MTPPPVGEATPQPITLTKPCEVHTVMLSPQAAPIHRDPELLQRVVLPGDPNHPFHLQHCGGLVSIWSGIA